MSFLDLDTSRIAPDELLSVRKSTPREHVCTGKGHQHTYPTQTQMSERVGLPASTWGHWERRKGVEGPGAAMIRMHLEEGTRFDPSARLSGEDIRALVRSIGECMGQETITGSCKAVADELGLNWQTVQAWIRRGNQQFTAGLLAHLIEAFGVGVAA